MKPETSTRKSPACQSVAVEDAAQTTPVRPPAWMEAPCSPRASVAYSFLLAIDWLRNLLRPNIGRRAQQRH
jgi:hypothetical protein